MGKPRIVHMVEAFEKVGGPPKLVRIIIDSPLNQKYEFHVVSYSISGLNLKAIMDLRQQLAALDPAIVHIHGLKADGFHATLAAKLARSGKILVTIHGSTLDAITEYHGPIMRLRQWVVGHVLERVTLTLTDAVYCVCDAMKCDPRVRRLTGNRLKGTIYNGIKPMPLVAKNNQMRKAFGYSDDDIVLIYTGRIAKDKGLEILASAMRSVISSQGYAVQGTPRANVKSEDFLPLSHSKIKLVLVGDGPESNDIRACFQPLIQMHHVVMTGKRDDIYALNAMADIFVFPSFHENLSFSLLEAMDAGLPVIATAVGGNVEIVVDGQTGLLVPSHDATALADGILRLCADGNLRRRMGLAGKERVENQFSDRILVEKTGDLYRSLLVANRRTSRRHIEA